MKLKEILPLCDKELNIDFESNKTKAFWEHDWRNQDFNELLEVIPEELLDTDIVKINGWDDGLTITINK